MEKFMMEKYKLKFDIHTHTVFSHGKGTIEDNVKVAIEKGLESIGISDHGPGHISYGIKRKDLPEMRRQIDDLNDKYRDKIKIYLGVEANIINPSGNLDVKKEEFELFDYVIAGYHFGIFGECPFQAGILHAANYLWTCKLGNESKWQKNKNTELVIKSLFENNYYLLTHPGDKGSFDIDAIAKACEETNTLMEISTWHPDLTVDAIKTAMKYDVGFIISSDAHHPSRVGDFEGGLKRAFEAGLDTDRIINLERI